jgi:methionyl-tRNA formyltransferase
VVPLELVALREPVAPARLRLALAAALVVAAGAGTSYCLLEIQPDGRRTMRARDFLAGHPVSPGARFGGPPS